MSRRALKSPWKVIDGSIYTVHEWPIQSETKLVDEHGKVRKVPDAIAYNVGDDLARHIVELHNNRANSGSDDLPAKNLQALFERGTGA